MYYNGFGGWCAAYAFLNTVRCTEITPELYELLSGVPFGIKYSTDDSFSFMIPLVEPCDKVDDTSCLLGYKTKLWQFRDKSEAIRFIFNLPKHERIMMGPIDMGYLIHLPQNMYYLGQSHYISIEKNENDSCFIADSECVPGYIYTEDRLSKVINTDKISEAEGLINIWQFNKVTGCCREIDYGQFIINNASINLIRAENEGQGSKAILRYAELSSDADINEWQLKMFYEINYALQRKKLIYDWQILNAHQAGIIKQQTDILCSIRESLMNKKHADRSLFWDLAHYEYELANAMS